jgi:hypothetical protein
MELHIDNSSHQNGQNYDTTPSTIVANLEQTTKNLRQRRTEHYVRFNTTLEINEILRGRESSPKPPIDFLTREHADSLQLENEAKDEAKSPWNRLANGLGYKRKWTDIYVEKLVKKSEERIARIKQYFAGDDNETAINAHLDSLHEELMEGATDFQRTREGTRRDQYDSWLLQAQMTADLLQLNEEQLQDPQWEALKDKVTDRSYEQIKHEIARLANTALPEWVQNRNIHGAIRSKRFLTAIDDHIQFLIRVTEAKYQGVKSDAMTYLRKEFSNYRTEAENYYFLQKKKVSGPIRDTYTYPGPEEWMERGHRVRAIYAAVKQDPDLLRGSREALKEAAEAKLKSRDEKASSSSTSSL